MAAFWTKVVVHSVLLAGPGRAGCVQHAEAEAAGKSAMSRLMSVPLPTPLGPHMTTGRSLDMTALILTC